jgi:hypothetical protein
MGQENPSTLESKGMLIGIQPVVGKSICINSSFPYPHEPYWTFGGELTYQWILHHYFGLSAAIRVQQETIYVEGGNNSGWIAYKNNYLHKRQILALFFNPQLRLKGFFVNLGIGFHIYFKGHRLQDGSEKQPFQDILAQHQVNLVVTASLGYEFNITKNHVWFLVPSVHVDYHLFNTFRIDETYTQLEIHGNLLNITASLGIRYRWKR